MTKPSAILELSTFGGSRLRGGRTDFMISYQELLQHVQAMGWTHLTEHDRTTLSLPALKGFGVEAFGNGRTGPTSEWQMISAWKTDIFKDGSDVWHSLKLRQSQKTLKESTLAGWIQKSWWMFPLVLQRVSCTRAIHFCLCPSGNFHVLVLLHLQLFGPNERVSRIDWWLRTHDVSLGTWTRYANTNTLLRRPWQLQIDIRRLQLKPVGFRVAQLPGITANPGDATQTAWASMAWKILMKRHESVEHTSCKDHLRRVWKMRKNVSNNTSMAHRRARKMAATVRADQSKGPMQQHKRRSLDCGAFWHRGPCGWLTLAQTRQRHSEKTLPGNFGCLCCFSMFFNLLQCIELLGRALEWDPGAELKRWTALPRSLARNVNVPPIAHFPHRRRPESYYVTWVVRGCFQPHGSAQECWLTEHCNIKRDCNFEVSRSHCAAGWFGHVTCWRLIINHSIHIIIRVIYPKYV